MKHTLGIIFGVILAILFVGILIDGDGKEGKQVVKMDTQTHDEASSKLDINYQEGFGSITDKELEIIEKEMFGEPIKGMMLKPRTKLHQEWVEKRIHS